MSILKECEDTPWPCKQCEKILATKDISRYPKYVLHLLRKHKTRHDLLVDKTLAGIRTRRRLGNGY